MNILRLIVLLAFLPFSCFSQLKKYQIKQHTSNGYSYETVDNDPLNARIYTLKNGLKVYLSVYKDSPRIQTYIAVRAGSKNDPATATGLAHYLEHMMFKGTTALGTLSWDKEKPKLDSIEALYEQYRITASDFKRKRIYHQIDSISGVAAHLAVPNEYDKLLSNMGATGTNAYTFVEQTVYVNNIPSNAIGRWAEIEAERFCSLAPRLFHTELEAVYEEKNRGLDSDNKKLWEAMLAGTFPDHPYGTQTTIGTVEHLKNPSIKEIKAYFQKYYVPNNMAICLSGDLDPDKTIQLLDTYFSKLKPLEVKDFVKPAAKNPARVREDTVWGPDAESVTIAYRFKGRQNLEISKDKDSAMVIGNTDPYLIKLLAMLLNNGQAGLIDLNLNQKQLVLSANAYDLELNDYSMLVLSANPGTGQSLEKVRDLLLEQIDLLKEGKYPDWLLKAVINDIKTSTMKSYESNKARADAFVDAFISHTPWNIFVMQDAMLETFTKDDITAFANRYLKDNYLVVYKKNGKDTQIQKVEKPKITPVSLNRDTNSVFYRDVMLNAMQPIEPVFIDYSKDLDIAFTKQKVKVEYKKNTENDLFNLVYIWDIGKKEDPKYGLAAGYLGFLGTKKYKADQLNEEFYKLGCNYSFSATEESVVFTLAGLNENFHKAYKLFEEIINEPQPNEEALKDYVQRILKAREDQKKSKEVILKSAMVNYAKYGPVNPFTNIISEEELKHTQSSNLLAMLKKLYSIEHRILYYGPAPLKDFLATNAKYHKVAPVLQPVKEMKAYDFKATDENKVFFVDYDMVQAEVIFLSKSDTFTKSIVPEVTLFNAYFGGGMGSLVFQEMRESKALAYAVKSAYVEAQRKEEPNYVYAYIGTQADKITEAIDGMEELMDKMPKSSVLFGTAKTSVLENIRTQRITKTAILWDYEKSKKLGLTEDIRKDIFAKVPAMTFEDLKKFQEKYFKDKSKTMLVIGSKNRIDLDKLNQYGKVQELTLKELFGY